MSPFFRPSMAATAFAILSACQMETGTASPDFAAMQAERLANTLAIVESCRASECGRLNLDSCLLDDYSPIAELTHVTALMTSFTDFDDLPTIAPMSQLRELHIGQTRVTDLRGLSNFPNLTLLHAQDLRVTDFGPIGQLNRLEELVVGGADVGALAWIARLTRLKSLSLDNATITDLAVLRGHPTLARLDLNDATLPADISVLQTIPNLRNISVSYWNMTDAQTAVIDALEARGVNVMISMPVVIVC